MSAALIEVRIAVTTTGADIDRETLAATLGPWLELVPSKYRNIQTVNAAGERVLIKLNAIIDAN